MLGHTAPVRGLAFSPDGGVLASAGEDRTISTYDVSYLADPAATPD
ncbi:WD40 repeat domain-containing protein [Nonomuraea wenchangensis]